MLFIKTWMSFHSILVTSVNIGIDNINIFAEGDEEEIKGKRVFRRVV